MPVSRPNEIDSSFERIRNIAPVSDILSNIPDFCRVLCSLSLSLSHKKLFVEYVTFATTRIFGYVIKEYLIV